MSKTFALLMSICLYGAVWAGEWHVDTGNKDNLVKFTSETLKLEFHGTTQKIDGYVYWEGEEMFLGNSQLQMDVDLNSVETGIGKRDRDMRDRLATDKYPITTYKGAIVSAEKIDSAVTAYRVISRGSISIRGVERELEVPALITITDGVMNVEARFEVKLSDFNIEIPTLMFLKVNENIRLYVNFFLNEAAG
ncbi:MAG: YceI family protein [Calditrichaeota bacterium]|nr:YceI family protein [Calditrichota bacterium]